MSKQMNEGKKKYRVVKGFPGFMRGEKVVWVIAGGIAVDPKDWPEYFEEVPEEEDCICPAENRSNPACPIHGEPSKEGCRHLKPSVWDTTEAELVCPDCRESVANQIKKLEETKPSQELEEIRKSLNYWSKLDYKYDSDLLNVLGGILSYLERRERE